MSRTDVVAFRMSQPLVPEPFGETGLSLLQFAHIVRVHWRRTLTVLLAAMLASGVLALVLPKTYTATATLMIDYQVSDPLGGREFPESMVGAYVATQVELVQSQQVLHGVIVRLHLLQDQRYSSGFHGDPAALPEWIEHKLAQKLSVLQSPSSQLIHVSFSSSSAYEAARVANAVVDTYLEQASQRMDAPATEQARRYTAQLDQLKQKVETAQAAITGFRQQHGIVDDPGRSDNEAALLASLEEKLAEAQTNRHAAEARLSGDSAVSAAVLGSGMVQTLKTQLAAEQAHLSELRATLGPRHPEVLQLQSQIATTRNALQSEIGSYANGAQTDASTARQFESKLAGSVEQQRQKVLELRREQDLESKLMVDLDSAQAVYKRALEGYDQVLAASSGKYSNTSVVDRATPPATAAKPKLHKTLALGALVGLLLAGGNVLLGELAQRRVRCRDDLERVYGIPVLAEFAPASSLRSPL